MNKILVALSGGTDSAATVLMLKEQGYDVRALYIDMLGDDTMCRHAQQTADMLGVTLHTERVQARFEGSVVANLLEFHSAGQTPSPCSFCNVNVKWAVLSEVADRLGIEKIATGHYVRMTQKNGHYYVQQGVDPAKDQSYYLWALGQDILSRAVTPLGSYTKAQVRHYLADKGFEVIAQQRESMSLCFLSRNCNYNDFLRSHLPVNQGITVNSEGQEIGHHDGFQLYTIGQKKGFTPQNQGYSVVTIDAKNNKIMVSQKVDALYSTIFHLRDYILHPIDTEAITVKVRGLGRNPHGECHTTIDGNLLRVELSHDDPAWAVAAGQPAVFYQGDIVVGGGILI